jgi:hypothetical protein
MILHLARFGPHICSPELERGLKTVENQAANRIPEDFSSSGLLCQALHPKRANYRYHSRFHPSLFPHHSFRKAHNVTSSPGPLQLGSSGLVQNRKSTCRIHECVSQSRMSQPTISGLRWKTLAVNANDESRHDLFISKGVRWNLLPDAGDIQPMGGGPESPSGKRGWRMARSRSGSWLFSDVQPFHAAGLVLSESERRHQLPKTKSRK